MKQKMLCLFMALSLMIVLSSCGSETKTDEGVQKTTDSADVIPAVEETDFELFDDASSDDQSEDSKAEEAEKFAEKIVYAMNIEDCDTLYLYLSDEYKEKRDEGTFKIFCEYWVYRSSFMLGKFIKIDDNTFVGYVSSIYYVRDPTIEYDFQPMIIYFENGQFRYQYFKRMLEFTDINSFCTDNLVWDDSQDCIEDFAKANKDEAICDYLGSETKVEYCKEKVRRLLE